MLGALVWLFQALWSVGQSKTNVRAFHEEAVHDLDTIFAWHIPKPLKIDQSGSLGLRHDKREVLGVDLPLVHVHDEII